MQRNNRTFLQSFAAAAGLLAVAAMSPQPPPTVVDASHVTASSASSSSTTVDRLRAAPRANALAAFGLGGSLRFSRRTYPRPGDSVRQHARKAARRRNQVRARRAARG